MLADCRHSCVGHCSIAAARRLATSSAKSKSRAGESMSRTRPPHGNYRCCAGGACAHAANCGVFSLSAAKWDALRASIWHQVRAAMAVAYRDSWPRSDIAAQLFARLRKRPISDGRFAVAPAPSRPWTRVSAGLPPDRLHSGHGEFRIFMTFSSERPPSALNSASLLYMSKR
jgi:hypothetical protein